MGSHPHRFTFSAVCVRAGSTFYVVVYGCRFAFRLPDFTDVCRCCGSLYPRLDYACVHLLFPDRSVRCYLPHGSTRCTGSLRSFALVPYDLRFTADHPIRPFHHGFRSPFYTRYTFHTHSSRTLRSVCWLLWFTFGLEQPLTPGFGNRGIYSTFCRIPLLFHAWLVPTLGWVHVHWFVLSSPPPPLPHPTCGWL